uniref:Peptidase M20 dimerisation domain-containing protein n=1 Tax=Kalanchoe fedtschenkoi TaxID=63787 RepID=A0A7N0TR30_KALFE
MKRKVVLLWLSVVIATSAASDDDDTPIVRFQEYLRINTAHPNPNYAAAVSYLTSQARSLQLQTTVFEFVQGKPLLLVTWPGSDPSLPSLLLNSHMDSVPAEPSKWIHPPFDAHKTDDGNIFARGAQDDKSIAMQYLEAIRLLKSKSFHPLRTLHLSYVPDEETGGLHGWQMFAKSKEFHSLNVGFMMDEGQASLGDEFRVFYADRTPWNLVIKAVGMPGHGSRMYDGGAMENLMKSVEIMTRFRHTQFDLVKAGLAAHSEGFVMNVQPSEAEAGFDIRLPPTADPDMVRKRIMDEWAPAHKNMTFQIVEKGPLRDYVGRPLMTPTDDSNPWWSIFKQAVTSAGGRLAKPEILSSTTDARYIRQLGIPVLGFSPMANTPILLHDHNEFLKDSVYLTGIKVYESIISSLSSYEGNSS